MVRRVSLVLIGCLVALLIAHTDVWGAVDLQYKFKSGEIVRHKVVVDMDLAVAANIPNAPQIPPMHMKAVGVVKQKTIRLLPDGNAEVVDTLESMTVTLGNQTHKVPVQKIPPMTGIVSKYGPSGSLSSGGGMLSGIPLGNFGLTQFILLPGQALSIGDYWTDTMSLPLGVNVEQKSKLVAENGKLGSHIVAIVKQEMSGSMDIPVSKLVALAGQFAPADCRIPVDGTIKALMLGDSATYFSVQKGRPIRSEGTLDLQMDANMTDGKQGAQFALRGRLNYSINLVTPK